MLTGKDIHAAFRTYDRHSPEWEEISAYARKAYNTVAEKLNASHITPLHGLLNDFYELLTDEDLMIEDASDSWHEKRDKALATVKQLAEQES